MNVSRSVSAMACAAATALALIAGCSGSEQITPANSAPVSGDATQPSATDPSAAPHERSQGQTVAISKNKMSPAYQDSP